MNRGSARVQVFTVVSNFFNYTVKQIITATQLLCILGLRYLKAGVAGSDIQLQRINVCLLSIRANHYTDFFNHTFSEKLTLTHMIIDIS